MKILVLFFTFLLMISFIASDTDPTTIDDTYNLVNFTSNLAKAGCESRCGDLIVPYPFGIGLNSGCSIGYGFDVYCNTSFDPPRGFHAKTDDLWIKQISDSTLRTSNFVSSTCYYPGGINLTISSNYTNWPYTFSKVNKFIVVGCDDYAWLTSGTKSTEVFTGCMVFCPKQVDGLSDGCSGNGCCQSSIPQDISYYTTEISSLQNSSGQRCTYAFLGEEGEFKFNGATDLLDPLFVHKIEDNVPRVLDWAIGNLSCIDAKEESDFACQLNSNCVSSTRKSGGYRCECKQGYEGNPYLFPGCQDIDECKFPGNYTCHGTCVNTQGNYTCKCKRGYSGDGKSQDGCRRKPFKTLLFSLGIGLLLLAILIGLSMIYLILKKRRLTKIRENFFEQNGGALLKDKLKTKGGVGVSSMNIFRVEELEEATNNFAEDNIIGKGGNGTVYKGTLSDKRVVAIKKSQRVDEGQREEFINEMVILTQINHQNVVQLLGCCLETDIPLLVYEFVSNDTLHRHIHNRKRGMGRLSWDNRLRIAHESAGALAYLHTDARMSIIHRDVKSTNILLDENYTAKIADFGASRLVPLGHHEVITLVQGTFGYLDPEYFHSGQLTDKSDVYSFGVVLAELITGNKPLGVERCIEDRNLATYFVKAKKENRMHEIVDRQVVNEATDEHLKAACDLVCRCLNLVGGNRPSMKEVTTELETLRKLGKHPWSSQDNENVRSSLIIESEEFDLYPSVTNSTDTFGEYISSSSSTALMKEIMLQVQDPR